MVTDLDLFVTLSPSMPHFRRFASDKRLAGIRINSAMMELSELKAEFEAVRQSNHTVPLYYDIKGRQLRVRGVHVVGRHLELELNHRVAVTTPTPVLFKGGADFALLIDIIEVEGRQRLVFADGAPQFNVKSGESICIRHPSFKVLSDTFPQYEVEKINRVVDSKLFSRYVLSYVENQADVDLFRMMVGDNAEIILKIENQRGLDWVKNGWKPQPKTYLMAARGDLYIELEKPHEILGAMKTIIGADKTAMVGSRILLSCATKAVPDAVDFSELAWLCDIGYRKMMLCDDLCIREERLAPAINAFDAFRNSYVTSVPKPRVIETRSYPLSEDQQRRMDAAFREGREAKTMKQRIAGWFGK